jgi:Bacteriophage T4-like portal protein (Gp20)
MAALFGWEFKRVEKDVGDQPVSFAQKQEDDGAIIVAAGGSYGTYLDLDGSVRTEAELVTRYREMSLQPECDAAVDEIVNESISIEEEHLVTLNVDELDIKDNLKKIMHDEFQRCLTILDFNRHAYEIYRRWYIDGRLYYHVIIDDKNPEAGIQEVRYIDPRKIRKVKEVQRRKIQRGGEGVTSVVPRVVNEYYVYNDRGFNYGNKIIGPVTTGIKIAKDAILHVTSGLTDTQGTMVLSYLHKAIKALNQLRTLEDALVIYRLARAPERRIWYIDVGNLPKLKAEQYVRDIMVKHKNRLVYDAQSGEIKDDRKFMTMLEDYWLPRREGGRGTEVTTLPGGQTLGQMDDVLYFQKKFYQCLNVPVNRINADDMFSLGRATEVSRDEVKFAKFIIRLRAKFATLFTHILGKQLILRKVFSVDDWEKVSADVKYTFAKDNYFAELKDSQIVEARLNLARNVQDMVGKYYSQKWVRREILHQSDDDIRDLDNEIKSEEMCGDPRWLNIAIINNQMMADQAMNGEPQEMSGEAQEADNKVPAVSRGRSGESEQTGEEQSKTAKMQNAKSVYDLLSQKSNRSLSDEAKFRSAAQVLAKNK